MTKAQAISHFAIVWHLTRRNRFSYSYCIICGNLPNAFFLFFSWLYFVVKLVSFSSSSLRIQGYMAHTSAYFWTPLQAQQKPPTGNDLTLQVHRAWLQTHTQMRLNSFKCLQLPNGGRRELKQKQWSRQWSLKVEVVFVTCLRGIPLILQVLKGLFFVCVPSFLIPNSTRQLGHVSCNQFLQSGHMSNTKHTIPHTLPNKDQHVQCQ